jgi:transposase
MSKRRTYQAVDIKALDVARLLAAVTAAVVVSIDVAKAAFVAAIRTAADGVIRIVRFEHPTETRRFLDLVKQLRARAGVVTVLMEPTGTYGDAVRYQLDLLGIEVRMIQPKRTHDAREVFDGVSSKHDPKDAVTMSRLHEAGASTKWNAPDEARRALRAMFDQFGVHESACEVLYSQIEARLARHWPELEAWLSIRKHTSARALLEQFVTPQRIAQDPTRARELLVRASHSGLSAELIAGVIESAQNTLGVPMITEEETLLRTLVVRLQDEIRACEDIEERIEKMVDGNGPVARMRDVVGIMAATAIVTYLGSPANYSCARALLKAAGLNMREISSGTEQGKIHITKRGPSIVRQLLYMAALRAIANDRVARAWYQGRETFRANHKAAAVVALMRKLLAGAYHVGKHDVAYDATKLFDTRRLTLTPTSEREPRRTRPKRRTQPRSIARGSQRARGAMTGGAST